MGGAGGVFSANIIALQTLLKQLTTVEQNLAQMNGQYAKLAADLHAGWAGSSGQKMAAVAAALGRTHIKAHTELRAFIQDMNRKLALLEQAQTA